MPLALLNPKLWFELAIVALIGAACWYGYTWVYDRGAASVQTQWDKERAEIQAQSAKVAADALATTKTLAATIETQRSATNAQISTLNATVASAVAGLRDRPARPGAGGVPGNPGDGAIATGCTGAQLYQDDGKFLARLAGDADKLRINLKACYAQYDAARKALAQ